MSNIVKCQPALPSLLLTFELALLPVTNSGMFGLWKSLQKLKLRVTYNRMFGLRKSPQPGNTMTSQLTGIVAGNLQWNVWAAEVSAAW